MRGNCYLEDQSWCIALKKVQKSLELNKWCAHLLASTIVNALSARVTEGVPITNTLCL